MLYVVLILFAVITMVFGLIARNKINKCENEKEKNFVKSKWQLICSLMGIACIIIAGIIIFTMF